MEAQRTFQLTIPRESLRAVLSTARLTQVPEADWCVACGAARAFAAKPPASYPAEVITKLAEPGALASFVKNMKDLGQDSWCVACGAGKGASPLEQLGDPAEVPDTVIDDLANRIINSVKFG